MGSKCNSGDGDSGEGGMPEKHGHREATGEPGWPGLQKVALLLTGASCCISILRSLVSDGDGGYIAGTGPFLLGGRI